MYVITLIWYSKTLDHLKLVMCAVVLETPFKKTWGIIKNTNGRRQADGSRADAIDPKPLDGIDGEKWFWKVVVYSLDKRDCADYERRPMRGRGWRSTAKFREVHRIAIHLELEPVPGWFSSTVEIQTTYVGEAKKD